MEEACSALKTHNHSAMCLYKLTQTMRVKQTSFIFLLFFLNVRQPLQYWFAYCYRREKKRKKKRKPKQATFFLNST